MLMLLCGSNLYFYFSYVAAAKDVIYKEQPLVPSAKEDVVEDAPSAVQMV